MIDNTVKSLKYGYYPNMRHTAPSKHIDFSELAEMAKAPTSLPKGNAALITPHNADGKKKEYAQDAQFHCLVLDFDDVAYHPEDIASKIRGFYSGAFLWFTTASHKQEGKGIRFKVVIPFSEPFAPSDYKELSLGLAIEWGADKAQNNITQGFYTPNTLHPDVYAYSIEEGDGTGLTKMSDLTIWAIDRFDNYMINIDKYAQQQPVKQIDKSILPNQDGTIIDLINQAYNVHDLLQEHNYIPQHHNRNLYLSPFSTSQIAGVVVMDNARVYSHHNNDPLSNNKHDGHGHDVASALCTLKYNGDVHAMVHDQANILDPSGQKQRQREHAQQQHTQDMAALFNGDVQERTNASENIAQGIANKSAQDIINILDAHSLSIQDVLTEINVNVDNIQRMITNIIRDGAKNNRLIMLNRSGYLNNHTEEKAWPQIVNVFGNAYDKQKLIALAQRFLPDANDPQQQKTIRTINSIFWGNILFHIEGNNQRTELRYDVDMFASQNNIIFTPHDAIVKYAFKPLNYANKISYDPYVIADYKEQFAELDEVLSFIIAARFASDRKNAYLWIRTPSNWGKSFFRGVLENLDMVVNISEEEIKNAFKGAPLGLSPNIFTHKYALIFEEFKTVNSELKRLENDILVTAKFQPTAKVPIYAKIFFSAQNVNGLINDEGSQSEHANRFNHIDKTTAYSMGLNERRMFIEIGSHKYIQHVTSYALEYMTTLIDIYVGLGEEAAAKYATDELRAFHNKYGLANQAPRLQDQAQDYANEFLQWVRAPLRIAKNGEPYIISHAGCEYLQQPSQAIRAWLFACYDDAQAETMKRELSDMILSVISEDGLTKAVARNLDKKRRVMQLKSMTIKPTSIITPPPPLYKVA